VQEVVALVPISLHAPCERTQSRQAMAAFMLRLAQEVLLFGI